MPPARWQALASLSPRAAQSSAKVARPKPANPPKSDSSREDRDRTFSPFNPVRSRIAINSVLLRGLEPNSRNRSRGRSPWGRSRIIGW